MSLVFALGAVGCANSASNRPSCQSTNESTFVLAAQAVETSPVIPCLETLPPGWQFAGSQISDGSVLLWLDSDLAGARAVEIALTMTCDTTGIPEVDPLGHETGARVFAHTDRVKPLSRQRFLVYDGGCVTHRYLFQTEAPVEIAEQVETALSTVPRSDVVDYVRDELGQTLCGTGAPPCEG